MNKKEDHFKGLSRKEIKFVKSLAKLTASAIIKEAQNKNFDKADNKIFIKNKS